MLVALESLEDALPWLQRGFLLHRSPRCKQGLSAGRPGLESLEDGVTSVPGVAFYNVCRTPLQDVVGCLANSVSDKKLS